MKYAFEMAVDGMVNLSNFMKIGTDIQKILRFWLKNVMGCNASINNGRDLLITPLRLNQMP
jgi:hypothetical protein